MDRPTYEDLVELTRVLNESVERLSTLADQVSVLAGKVVSLEKKLTLVEQRAKSGVWW